MPEITEHIRSRAQAVQAWAEQGICAADLTWAERLPAHPVCIGVEASAFSSEQRWLLQWTGVPLAAQGLPAQQCFRWEDVQQPVVAEDGRVALPPVKTLLACTSVQLKPIRQWVAEHFGLRLQGGAGLLLWLTQTHAIVFNASPVLLAGFLHGPGPARRRPFQIESGHVSVLGIGS